MNILDKFKLNGKVAIVTGAGRGLGMGMALCLAEAGANLAVVGSASSTDETAKKIRAFAGYFVDWLSLNMCGKSRAARDGRRPLDRPMAPRPVRSVVSRSQVFTEEDSTAYYNRKNILPA